MSTQALLNFDVPRSRNTDPPSSHRAEGDMKRSGAMRGQQLIALELVKQYPGRSSKELAQMGTLDRYQLARRLSDLQRGGHVRAVQVGAEDKRWWVK